MHYSFCDKVIMAIDTGLNTIAAKHIATREYPAEKIKEADLSNSETKHIAGLMRVNHAGEIAAQALYLGQAITARNQLIREKMQTAASEEIDHLAWCETRLEELNSHISYLAPIWLKFFPLCKRTSIILRKKSVFACLCGINRSQIHSVGND